MKSGRSFLGITPRHIGAVLLDAVAVALSFHLAFTLRIQGPLPVRMAETMAAATPWVVLISILTFEVSGLYRRAWRYVSVGDVLVIGQASILAVLLSAAAILLLMGKSGLPVSVPVIHWLVLVVLLSAMRVGRRLLREMLRSARAGRESPPARTFVARPGGSNVLVIGEPDWIETLLRILQRRHDSSMTFVGALGHDESSRNLRIRGVPVLGTIDDLGAAVASLDAARCRPDSLIVNQDDPLLTGPRMARLAARAAQLGLEVASAIDPAQLHDRRDGGLDLDFLNLTDLLGRPELTLGAAIVSEAVRGRRVLVTGAGGSIGGELVRQLAAFEPAEIVLLDHAEYSLYAIHMEMREKFPDGHHIPLLCSVRERDELIRAFAAHRPELVFHAAALKHVPLVEEHPCAGILTNVIGTRNVADATLLCGARMMTQVSTDKAVNPVGMMGVTKRLGELYCQALDLAGAGDPGAPRFMTVRFGNVLGSSGSLIPLFLRQLSRRGPLTVTHPDIERYFMTVREAVQLILHSCAGTLRGGIDRGRIFVLDMGAPIKITEIARRMIRAAGLEPDIDIKIDFVGLRPGEKLFEELFDTSEERLVSSLPGVFEAEPDPIPLTLLTPVLRELEALAEAGDIETACRLARSVLAGEILDVAAEPEFFDVWPIHGHPLPVLQGATS